MTVLDYRSGIDERAAQPRSGVRNWLGWAVYLGMSWTWCIGMFLPVLLIRDYGVWAWWVFAVPNVIGAAAMGWTVDESRSAELVAQHEAAVQSFSFITAAFQIFFAVWMFRMTEIPLAAWGVPAIAVVIALAAWAEDRIAIFIAVVIFAISLVCSMNVDSLPQALIGSEFPRALLALTPVCVFGFALCPYLDGTFHRARQRAGAHGGRTAFGVGFGVFFFTMIYFTLVYSHFVIRWMENAPYIKRGLIVAVGVHWMFQLAFTTGIHWQGIGVVKSLCTIFVGALLGIAIPNQHHLGNTPGEVIYRLFMAFYGLVFPAYVWLCMIPTWREPAKPSRKSLGAFAGSVVVAAPFYWMGFIEQRMFWLLPGLAIVLLARLLVPAQRTVPPTPATA